MVSSVPGLSMPTHSSWSRTRAEVVGFRKRGHTSQKYLSSASRQSALRILCFQVALETLASLLLQDMRRVGSSGAPESGPWLVAEPSLCSRGTQVDPWSVRRMVWLTCMVSSAGVMAVGGSTSRESTPVCPITWTGSTSAFDHPSDL